MDLTFSSLFTTTFYSSVLFLCIFFMLKKANRMRQVGVRTLILCILLWHNSFDSFKINVSI